MMNFLKVWKLIIDIKEKDSTLWSRTDNVGTNSMITLDYKYFLKTIQLL